MSTFIECDNLVKIYKIAELEVVALQGLDLSIDEGEMIAVIGPSGSGKSSLMNVLGGPDIPSAGKVKVGQYDLLEMSRRQQTIYRCLCRGYFYPGRFAGFARPKCPPYPEIDCP
jgi:ABC-type lipoprotein export system ATPase subunit